MPVIAVQEPDLDLAVEDIGDAGTVVAQAHLLRKILQDGDEVGLMVRLQSLDGCDGPSSVRISRWDGADVGTLAFGTRAEALKFCGTAAAATKAHDPGAVIVMDLDFLVWFQARAEPFLPEQAFFNLGPDHHI